jgi:osmotically inducible protein OsmC
VDRGRVYGAPGPGPKSRWGVWDGWLVSSGKVELTSSGAGTFDVDFPKRAADDAAGGFKLTGITLTVRGEVEGLNEAGFAEAADKAKAGCPISKALAGVEITLDAALEG